MPTPATTPRHEGFVFDEFSPESAWIREHAVLRLPALGKAGELVIEGESIPHPEVRGSEIGWPNLEVRINGRPAGRVVPANAGAWRLTLPLNDAEAAAPLEIRLRLRGVTFTNTLAWLGRVLAAAPGGARLQRFRSQNRNRQLRVRSVVANGERAFDFSSRHAPYSPVFARRHASLGLNLLGYFTADLGIGESARCMLRAAQAAAVPVAPIELRLPCKATRNDKTYESLLQTKPEHAINCFHVDAPGAPHLAHHHGRDLLRDRHNIGYLAWELAEFPDAWMPHLHVFDEIWCPSDFVRIAIAEKSPRPVLTVPHAIAFPRPVESTLQLRTRLGLPADKYLFLFLYDLNSYSERKNPRAVIEAFRLSGLSHRNAALIIKVHGARGNEADLAALRQAVADLPGTVLLTENLSRKAVYELEAACDCFVSLHRSEGFGLAVAESMYLGKPVIATDWSATAEYLNETNGCPVRHRLCTIERSHGPYSKGQFWADPDPSHAAEWMQRLYDDPSLGHLVGTAARSTIETLFSPAAVGARLRRRLETIASW
ncbi:glycosyltransferase family 4 protein [Nibricoccus sp. IMCC34717]|uniref:glycosyltransferase family 4 protein n=1 Tax=Nibricoccus sp. IMCC34717 TaxID=3034021 RepID=UPI00384B27B3